jgi:porphobilinogen synthase
MSSPIYRLRRLRGSAGIRKLVCENQLRPSDFVMPVFVGAASGREPLRAIPGVDLLGGAALEEEAVSLVQAGVPAALVFGVIDAAAKDARASYARNPHNSTCQAIRRLKDCRPELAVMADLCLCEYTSHGHCGIVKDGLIHNGLTLDALAESAVAVAQAGADAIAPSGVMDGVVATLREALDDAGFAQVALVPYSAKYASHFYGPFKSASRSAPCESLHATHQIPVANRREALRKIQLDVEEGADMVIVKPALTSLDILTLAQAQTTVPLLGYDVSGFYKMVADYCGDDQSLRHGLMLEILTCIKRAGAQMIITYYAKAAARGG